jgi:hypothetical protein
LFLGAALTLAGLTNVSLVLWPLGLGSPDWELAAFGELASTWALVGIGCAVLIVASVRSKSRRPAAVSAIVLLLMGALAVGGAAMVLLNVPLVWRTQLPQVALTQLKIATVKAVALNAVYGAGYVGIGLTVLWALFSKKARI